MGCNCKTYEFATDYKRICNLAQGLANIEKRIYVVFQKENKSYGFSLEEYAEGPIQFRAIPID